jgi:hypothetical protein
MSREGSFSLVSSSSSNGSVHQSFPWKNATKSIKIFVASLLLFSDCNDVPGRLDVDGLLQKNQSWSTICCLRSCKVKTMMMMTMMTIMQYMHTRSIITSGIKATRNYMLVCWLLYVVLPMSAMFSASVWKHKKATYHFITATTCGFGALIISYFDVLYVCYTASHHIQGPALFVLGSMLAVLFLSGKNEQTSSI